MKIKFIISAFFIIVFSVFVFLQLGEAAIIFQDNFDGYEDSPLNHGWGYMGSQVSATSAGGHNGSRGIVVAYNSSGYTPFVFNKNIAALELQGVYTRFYFKVENSNPLGGSKFMKYFGIRDGDNYANTTFMINYFNCDLYEISYGDGGTITNDTSDVIRYAGTVIDDELVVVNVSEGTYDPSDSQWHSFETYMKYNTNDQRDGEYKIWIDGILWVHATNVKNRHNSNSLFFNRVEIGGYAHSNWDHLWYLWYDNVVISDEYIGPLDSESAGSHLSGITSAGITWE